MSPAIKSGQILLVNKLSYGFRLPTGRYLVRWAEPKEGDIVVFWTPYGDLAVKRAAALNGTPAKAAAFAGAKAAANGPSAAKAAALAGSPAGSPAGAPTGGTEFLALGDNAGASFDSRFYGPVSTDNILGKVAAPAGKFLTGVK